MISSMAVLHRLANTGRTQGGVGLRCDFGDIPSPNTAFPNLDFDF